jgi:hypothetical protein
LPFLAMEDQVSKEVGATSINGSRTLLDTSAVIDGRIADIAEAGFAPGILVASRFMLAELQNIADSDDAMRRGRGRRGLEVLNRLREMPGVTVEVIEEDVQGIREVDAKLVVVAQRHGWNVLTTDYNLNRVAAIQGVKVLNVNELSNAIRPVVLPGEPLMVRVVQPGKERNQGVGYLADGTMIVVENGDKLMGQEVETEVTRVFQTVAGKMIFAVPRKPIPGVEAKPVPAASPATPAPSEVSTPTPLSPSEPAKIHGRKTSHHSSGRHQSSEPKPAPAEMPAHQAGVQNAAAVAATNTNASGNGNGNGSGRPNRPDRDRRPGGRSNNNGGNKRSGASASIEERIVRQNQQAPKDVDGPSV